MSADLFDEVEYKNSFYMISRDGCGYCEKALSFFNTLNIPVQIKKVITDEDRQAFLRNGHRTFPRVFMNGNLIGGYDDLISHVASKLGNE